MPLHAIPGYSRLNRNHKLSAAAVATGGAAALIFTVVPGSANAEPTQAAQNVKPVAYHVVDDSSAYSLVDNAAAKAQHAELTQNSTRAAEQASASALAAKKQAEGDAKAAAQAKAKAAADAAARAKEAAKNQAASRSAERQPVTYPNNLDGWIRESLAIMKKHGIPGSYEGIKRNIIRESGGNPRAINNWDVNAQMGIPSKGLLQVIKPTFDQYHVEGTAHDQYDPVANIVAACNYAADKYGSMDNVDSAY
ncbi:transglycosylase SLT domain-containing protein [Streptomyces sp. NPDC050315]|uniref:transglycosylase SLT domain-containing protein n=1 Tax=Streptomyces sp. NPDC050315 TaxID=3155039 RepID=UPI0034224D4C